MKNFGSIGAIVPRVYVQLLALAEHADATEVYPQIDPRHRDLMREKLVAVIKINTRADCGALMVGKDACYAPVLSLSEASEHIQDLLRNTFVRYDDVIQSAPIQHCSCACLSCLTAIFMRRRSGWCRIRSRPDTTHPCRWKLVLG